MPEVLRRDNPILVERYADILELFPNAEFMRDGSVIRFNTKPFACWLRGQVSLNDMAVAASNGLFPIKDYMQFYQDIGYSLEGFIEIFCLEMDCMKNWLEESPDLGGILAENDE